MSTAIIALLALSLTAEAQIIPWLNWTLLPQNQMDEIIGEASGETAWKTIASIAAFNRDRRPEEFKEMFLETKVITGLLKDYGISGFEVKRYPDGTAWDASKGELWETQPRRRKIASFNDMVPMLAAWSAQIDATADLVWVGKGSPDEIKKANVQGKIVVTDGNILMVHMEACGRQGAIGVVAINTNRQLDDPLQLPWSQIKMPSFPGMPEVSPAKTSTFGFALPAREGELLKQRLLAGEKITARAQVEAKEVPYNLEVTSVLHLRNRSRSRRSHFQRPLIRRQGQTGRQRRHFWKRLHPGSGPRHQHAHHGRTPAPSETNPPFRLGPPNMRERENGSRTILKS